MTRDGQLHSQSVSCMAHSIRINLPIDVEVPIPRQAIKVMNQAVTTLRRAPVGLVAIGAVCGWGLRSIFRHQSQ